MEHVLCQVQADRRTLVHGLALYADWMVVTPPPSWRTRRRVR
jgi:hypothetical protein